MPRPFLALLTLLALLAGPSPLHAQTPADGALRPGDVIRLRIWQEPGLSGEFAVDEQGEVVLPKVGRMQVGDTPPLELERQIVSAYESFLQHSSVEVTLLRRVQVLGAVRNPGLYPVDATMTISDALALAGGATDDGEPNRVELIRGGKRIQARLRADAKVADSSIRSGDQLYVPERSWFERNTGVVAAGLSAGASLIIAFLAR